MAIGKLTALGLYIAVTTEMDKTNSASFTITEFNYYANRQQLKLQADLVDVFETTQVLSDLLGPFVSRQAYTPTSTPSIQPGEICRLPTDYSQVLRALLTYKANASFGAYRQNETIDRTAKRLTADQQEFVDQPNHYFKPTFDRIYRRVVGGNLELFSGVHSRLDLVRVLLEYIKLPDQIVLYESDVKDLTVDNSQQLQWTTKATFDIAQYITKALMERTGSQRLNTYAALNQPNVGAPPQPQASQQQAQRASQQAADGN